MGFFDKVLGNKKEFPPLAQEHPVMSRLQRDMPGLEILAREISDPIELVPAEKMTYVFIGKPPKQFGMAWVEGREVRDFKTLGKQKGMTSLDLKPFMEKIKETYEKNRSDEHFSTKVADRDVVVTPTAALASEVEQIIQGASS